MYRDVKFASSKHYFCLFFGSFRIHEGNNSYVYLSRYYLQGSCHSSSAMFNIIDLARAKSEALVNNTCKQNKLNRVISTHVKFSAPGWQKTMTCNLSRSSQDACNCIFSLFLSSSEIYISKFECVFLG